MKKAQGNMMVGLAVGVILLIVILGVIFVFIRDNALAETVITDETIAITFTEVTIAENVTLAAGRTNVSNVDLITLDFFGNQTVNTSSEGITVGIHVNFTRLGQIVTTPLNFSVGDYNVTYTLITNGTGQTANLELSALDFFGNTSVNTSSTGITLNTDVNFTTNGIITVAATNFTAGDYRIDYKFFPSSYLASGTTRILASNIPVLLVIVILLFIFSFVVLKKGS